MALETTVTSTYTQSVAGCLDGAIAEHGLPAPLLASYIARLQPHLEALREDYRTGRLPLLRIAEETEDVSAMQIALRKLAEGAELLLFLGTGGSSLGGQTLVQLAELAVGEGPAVSFLDNLDGATLAAALEDCDLAATRFVVTSKSGGTAETLAQAIVALTAVKDAGLEALIPNLFLGITEPAKPGKANGLRDLFGALNIPMLEHHTGIGGRFSCLTNVGLLPAAAADLDVAAIRAGARSVVEAMLGNDATEFAPAIGAATAVALSKERGVHTLVMMPYHDGLARFSAWFVQLWAESLGKAGEGTSPIAALGPLDQHSQLQLFMDGPREHFLTVVRVASKGVGPRIDRGYAKLAGIEFMGGYTIGDVVDAQAHAVPEALARAGRPVRTVDIARLDEKSLGALLMHFMIETILAGRLLGVDPFDQPAVELAKILTKERLKAGS